MTADLLPLTKEKGELQVKRHQMPATTLSARKKVAFTIFCCTLLMLFAAPAWAQTPCPPIGLATGCGVVITVDSSGTATPVITGQPPYDGVEDTLVGIVNSSGGSFASITLSASLPIFGFDGDGPCNPNLVPHNTGSWCPPGYPVTPSDPNPVGYEGPNNTFSNISGDFKTGTINFTTPLANGGSTWFALEGPPTAVTVGAISQTTTLNYSCPNGKYPCKNVQQQATFDCGGTNQLTTGGCSSSIAHSAKFTYDQVNSPFSLQINATEVDGDGMCTIPDGNANNSVPTDFDCTLANFFGSTLPSYTMYPYKFPAGASVNTPYCLHYARNLSKCVDIEAILVSGETGTESSGFLHIYIAWNADTNLLFLQAPQLQYANNPQLYDAPHNDQDTVDYPPAPKGYPYPGANTDLQKVFNVTGYYNVHGIAGLDGGVGTGPPSGVKKPNHYVVAFPFTPPDVGELLFAGFWHPNSTTTCYPKGWPMLASFEIEKGEQQDPNVQTPSHPLRVTVLQDGVYQNIGNPTVNHLFGTIYYVFLSNANLPVNSATNLIPYQLQVSTDLIPAPLTQNFVVQNSCFSN